MKTTSKKVISVLVLTLTLIGSSPLMKAANTDSKPKPVYLHYLVFWLKPDLTDKQAAEFTNFFEGLSKLPYQKNLRYGKPAASTPRAVLDQTYSYSVVMEFDSLEELEAYGKLPEHLSLVEKYKPYFYKMLVNDTVLNK